MKEDAESIEWRNVILLRNVLDQKEGIHNVIHE